MLFMCKCFFELLNVFTRLSKYNQRNNSVAIEIYFSCSGISLTLLLFYMEAPKPSKSIDDIS